MKERPILFSAPMVRAILDGRKTQTRRVCKLASLKPSDIDGLDWQRRESNGDATHYTTAQLVAAKCPYGAPGDRLWVREAWRPAISHSCGMEWCDCADVRVSYAADGEGADWTYFGDHQIPAEWCIPKAAKRGNVPPIHMPRWASRITLEVIGVRVERLQAITGRDVLAEGVDNGKSNPAQGERWENMQRLAFEELWRSINGAESWDANPLVWVVEFKRVEAR